MVTQTRSSDSSLRLFAGIAYLTAALCVLMPPLDVIFSLGPLQLETVRWRFGAVGLLTGGALLPVIGMLLAAVTAIACRHRWGYWIVTVVTCIGIAGLLGLLGLFALDALQIRTEIAAPMLRRFDITIAKAVLTQVAVIAALIVLLRATVRAKRAAWATSAAERDAQAAAPGVLIRERG